jgi:O-Antigen ligase
VRAEQSSDDSRPLSIVANACRCSPEDASATMRRVVRPAPAVAVPLVLVPALGLTQGGFSPDTWVWAGALAAWGVAVAIVVDDDAGALRRGWRWLAWAGALLGWTLASALWSAHTAQSLLDARRTLLYVAVALALITLARAGGTAALVIATQIAITFLLVYALVRYLLGAHELAEFEGYTLADPLGYANAVGIVAVLGSLLGLGIAARAGSVAGRAAAAATIPPLALALQLTRSNASWLALAVGLGIALLLDEVPARVVRTAGVVAAPSAALVLLGWRSGFATLATPRIAGWVLLLAAVAAALGCAALAYRFTGSSPAGRRPPLRLVVIVTSVCAALALTLVVAYGSSTEPRASYYRVAWHEYAAHPLLGSGAGTFALYWARSGHVASRGGALDAHSLYLETLAELGPLGLALVAAFLLYPFRAALTNRRVPYVPVAASAYVAFLVHAGLDWDWELPVVVVAGLACAAALVASTVTSPSRLATWARGLVLAAALVLGAFAIAGARSDTVPAARDATKGAPLARGPSSPTAVGAGYDLP